MYRSRLGTDLSDITLDYVSSINDDFQIALYDIIGSQAHILMLYENQIITKNDAKKAELQAVEETFKKSVEQARKDLKAALKVKPIVTATTTTN